MQKQIVNFSAPCILYICIDEKAPGLSGRIYHKYSDEPVHFREDIQFIFTVDAFFDWINFPQATMQLRSFKEEKGISLKKKDTAEIVNSNIDVEEKGDKGTFILHVRYRQNATWQGTVTWLEQEQTMNFRSALELIKLIDSALNEEDTLKSVAGQ